MKWYILLLIFMVLFLLIGCTKSRNTDDIDGGVVTNLDENAPKEIKSQKIVSFYCKFSTMDLSSEDTAFAGEVYTLKADENTVSFETRNKVIEGALKSFAPDEDFFKNLQDIVAKYELVKYNGKYHSVSGLPPDFGIKLEIIYDSKESIKASDNQDCFLSIESIEELLNLFIKIKD